MSPPAPRSNDIAGLASALVVRRPGHLLRWVRDPPPHRLLAGWCHPCQGCPMGEPARAVDSEQSTDAGGDRRGRGLTRHTGDAMEATRAFATPPAGPVDRGASRQQAVDDQPTHDDGLG